jgi:hypothetical protein
LNRSVRTAVVTLIPLLMASVAAQAIQIPYEFGTSVTFGCVGTDLVNCSGGGGGGILTPSVGTYGSPGSAGGGAQLYVNPPDTYTEPSPSGGDFTVTWSGSGDGVLLSSMPILWDFSLTPVGGSASIQWDLQFVLNPGGPSQTVVFDSGLSSVSGGGTFAGSANPSTISGTAMGTWAATLTVEFSQLDGGTKVRVSEPNGNALDLGSAVPEPSTWSQAGGGLLLALMMAARKLRRQ